MSYKEIINYIVNDPEYIRWMDIIDKSTKEFADFSSENAKITFDHSTHHALEVAKTTARLLCDLGLDERMQYLGFIAGLLHDIGIIEGKKSHAKTGYEMSKVYMKKLEMSDEDIDMIAHAILVHGNVNKINNPLDGLLAIADKSHFKKNRIVKSKHNVENVLERIEDNHICIENGVLKIFYLTTTGFDKSSFYTIPKTIDLPIKVGNELGYEVEIYINGVRELFEDKKSYKGFTYKS